MDNTDWESALRDYTDNPITEWKHGTKRPTLHMMVSINGRKPGEWALPLLENKQVRLFIISSSPAEIPQLMLQLKLFEGDLNDRIKWVYSPLQLVNNEPALLIRHGDWQRSPYFDTGVMVHSCEGRAMTPTEYLCVVEDRWQRKLVEEHPRLTVYPEERYI